MIIVNNHIVVNAFICLGQHEQYKRWFDNLDAIVALYGTAEQAFNGQNNIEAFQTVYGELSGKWQVFRGGQNHWDMLTIYQHLNDLAQNVRQIHLSDQIDWKSVWNCIYAIRNIKQTKSDPSLVAISKFLHFWNPRLFVIFDSEVVENWVFRHKYLADQLNSPTVNNVIEQLQLGENGRLIKYLRVLIFAKKLLDANPVIMRVFADRYKAIRDYEATAVEWFLLGLVELPPEGICLSE